MNSIGFSPQTTGDLQRHINNAVRDLVAHELGDMVRWRPRDDVFDEECIELCTDEILGPLTPATHLYQKIHRRIEDAVERRRRQTELQYED